jgi:hypothetical protein
VSYSRGRRVPVAAPAAARGRQEAFSPPVRGWVTAANIADAPKNSAYKLDDFFPTQRGIIPRGGSQPYATLSESDPVQRIMPYQVAAGARLFAATETDIYDISTPISAETPIAAIVTGRTSGYYSSQQITTSGGTYLELVNGTDELLLFNGATFFPISDTALFAIDYDAETQTFVAGRTLTGGTSGATAEIVQVFDDGLTGTLWVRDVTGTFQDNETITGSSSGGSATANGIAVQVAAAITGVDTSALSHVNLYRSRLYFVEGGTMDIHYLPVDSITGALGTRSMGGIFKKGGAVLFTSTWSPGDAGDGLDDKFVVVTTEGEAAIFQGGNPAGSAAGDFALVGVYDIGFPIGKNFYFKAGGDLVIGTVDGLVPLSVAMSKDPGALSLSAVTRPIEPEWQKQYRERGTSPWEVQKWTSRNMAIVALPAPNDGDELFCFVVNIETGAWCRYTGWDCRCLGLFNDRLFFGSSDGVVWEGEVTGRDGLASYFPVYVGHAEHLKAPGRHKSVYSMRTTFTGSTPMEVRVSCSTDYRITLPPWPNAPEAEGDVGWDASLWDEGLWDESGAADASLVVTRWSSIGRSGHAINPQIQMTCGTTIRPDNELASFDLIHEVGAGMV